MRMKDKQQSQREIECDEKLKQLLAERPAYNDKPGYSQISAVRELLLGGEYVDFWRAFEQCQKTQRLSAVIHILRHEAGLPIVEWQPTDFGGSVYCLFAFAPEKVQKQWEGLDKMTKEQIMAHDFNRARKKIAAQIEGQMTVADYLEELDKDMVSPKTELEEDLEEER